MMPPNQRLYQTAVAQVKRKPKARLSNFARAPQHSGNRALSGFRKQQSY